MLRRLAVGGILGWALFFTQPAGSADEPKRDADAIKLKIVDHAGLEKVIAGHKGKVVVVDFWSTWCTPCVREFPGLVELHKKYGEKQVACISVSLDFDGVGKPEEQQEPVLEFLREQKATFDNLMSGDPDELCKNFQFPAPPSIFVYGKDGKLARQIDSTTIKREPTYEKDVNGVVEELLKAN